MRLALLIGIGIALTGCTEIRQPAGMISRWTSDWREVVTADDRSRLRDWRKTFIGALGAARLAGHSAEIAREGPLLDPDSALGGGPIPNGTYRCRVIKLGAKATGMLDYVTYPPFTCEIRPERNLQAFAKVSGSQRPVGILFRGDSMRQVFLGTLVVGDERRALRYGEDETRDVAGFIERIGPDHWRLVMPRPHFESQLDVMELAPSPQGVR